MAAPSPSAEPGARPIRIGVSSCLLGQEVRWDGGHQRDRFVTDVLGPFVEFVPVCPEVGSGLSTPRETLRLVGEVDAPRLVFNKSGEEHTPALQRFAREEMRRLEALDLCGYVLKKDSPSCGMERVKVYGKKGSSAVRKGVGVFARVLMERFPLLPVEEDGRLNDAVLRETFVERVFAYRRWRDLLEEGFTPGRLVDFHRRHKYLLLAHSPQHYSELGRVVAQGKKVPRARLRDEYGRPFMEGMARKATVGKHYNVLQHMAGYFKERLDDASRSELHQVLADYRARLVPLIVPVTLIRHHVRALEVEYLADQVYLAPNPKELMLRNHV
jgi:uncharacterized protein YbgA (DUF1722 family)/uncharacterized protein YbbK (DUF523 family)